MTESAAGGGPVVIAYDGSPAARQAIVASARFLGSCQILVAAVWEEGVAYAGAVMPPDSMTMTPMPDPETAHDLDSAMRAQAEQLSAEGAALAGSLGLNAEPLALPDEGNTANTILELARERNAVAIVVGSRGLSGLRARLEGSTSKGLLKHASCPVIVVHADEDAHEHRGR